MRGILITKTLGLTCSWRKNSPTRLYENAGPDKGLTMKKFKVNFSDCMSSIMMGEEVICSTDVFTDSIVPAICQTCGYHEDLEPDFVGSCPECGSEFKSVIELLLF